MIREEVEGRFGEKWMQDMVSHVRSADLKALLESGEQDTAISNQNRQQRLQNLLPHQLTNLAIAVKAFQILESSHSILNQSSDDKTPLTPPLLETVLTDASKSYPARLQRLDPGWLDSAASNHNLPRLNATTIHLDGAHNEQSAIVLREYIDRETTLLAKQPSKSNDLRQNHPESTATPTTTILNPTNTIPTISILALSSTKPPLEILRTLLCDYNPTSSHPEPANTIIFTSFSTPASMPWVRSTPTNTLVSTTSQLNLPNTTIHTTENIVEALDLVEHELEGYDDGLKPKPLIVVAGSLYLASDFLRFVRDGRGMLGDASG